MIAPRYSIAEVRCIAELVVSLREVTTQTDEVLQSLKTDLVLYKKLRIPVHPAVMPTRKRTPDDNYEGKGVSSMEIRIDMHTTWLGSSDNDSRQDSEGSTRVAYSCDSSCTGIRTGVPLLALYHPMLERCCPANSAPVVVCIDPLVPLKQRWLSADCSAANVQRLQLVSGSGAVWTRRYSGSMAFKGAQQAVLSSSECAHVPLFVSGASRLPPNDTGCAAVAGATTRGQSQPHAESVTQYMQRRADHRVHCVWHRQLITRVSSVRIPPEDYQLNQQHGIRGCVESLLVPSYFNASFSAAHASEALKYT